MSGLNARNFPYPLSNANKQKIEESRKKHAEEQRIRFAPSSSGVAKEGEDCFQANRRDGKIICPECGAVAGGLQNIMWHSVGCKNKGRSYCPQLGGKRKIHRTVSRKNRKSKNRKTRGNRR